MIKIYSSKLQVQLLPACLRSMGAAIKGIGNYWIEIWLFDD